MHRAEIVGLSLIFLTAGGCARASAETPDSNNPAQCIAADNFARMAFAQAGPEHLQARIEAAARQLYEVSKLRAAGRADGGAEEAKSFTLKYGGDRDVMMRLLDGCDKAQDREPDFRANRTSWLMMARKMECGGNSTCGGS